MIIDTKRVTWTQTELATENRTVEDASVESEIERHLSECRDCHLVFDAANSTLDRYFGPTRAPEGETERTAA